MSELHSHNSWHKAADAWKVRFLPEGQLVVDERDQMTMFVIRVYDCGAVCWPAQKGCDTVWAPSRKITELLWRFCFNLDEASFKVIPTEVSPPLRSWVKFGSPSGVCVRQTGEAVPVLRWHAEHGFPNIPEAMLKRLLGDYGVVAPRHSGSGDYATELTMTLMRTIDPGMTQKQAVNALRKGHFEENPELKGQLCIDEEMLRDVLVQSETVDLRSLLKSLAVSKAKFEMHARGGRTGSRSTSGGRRRRAESALGRDPRKPARLPHTGPHKSRMPQQGQRLGSTSTSLAPQP